MYEMFVVIIDPPQLPRPAYFVPAGTMLMAQPVDSSSRPFRVRLLKRMSVKVSAMMLDSLVSTMYGETTTVNLRTRPETGVRYLSVDLRDIWQAGAVETPIIPPDRTMN